MSEDVCCEFPKSLRSARFVILPFTFKGFSHNAPGEGSRQKSQTLVPLLQRLLVQIRTYVLNTFSSVTFRIHSSTLGMTSNEVFVSEYAIVPKK